MAAEPQSQTIAECYLEPRCIALIDDGCDLLSVNGALRLKPFVFSAYIYHAPFLRTLCKAGAHSFPSL
jgi:hypothetical protein